MNDHRLPPDELASAFLDDELGAAEADAVRKDPDLAARAGELLGAAEAVGETVTPPPGAADAAVEAALADFDARRGVPADMARRPRSLAVIAGVAAAVLVGFIVAAAVGLFTEQQDDGDTAAAPASAAPAEAAAPPAESPVVPPPADFLPQPAPAPAPELPPPPATTAAVEVQTSEPLLADAFIADEAPAAEAPAAGGATALEEAQAAADAAGAEAGAAAAELESAGEAAAQRAAAEAAPVAEPPPPADDEAPAEDMAAMEADDDPSGPAADVTTAPAQASCADAIGDRTVGLRFIIGGTPILVVQSTDGTITAIDGTTCTPIPPDDGSELVADPAPDGCRGAIGDRTVGLRFIIGGTPILVVQSTGGTIAAIDGTTCTPIPPG